MVVVDFGWSLVICFVVRSVVSGIFLSVIVESLFMLRVRVGLFFGMVFSCLICVCLGILFGLIVRC